MLKNIIFRGLTHFKHFSAIFKSDDLKMLYYAKL